VNFRPGHAEPELQVLFVAHEHVDILNDAKRAAKMPPEWNQRTPPPKMAFQSKSPGFSNAPASLDRL
jgi:hypothetical protein